jgi:hypothetical protein
MMVVGVDPHKQSHTAVAVDELGRNQAAKTVKPASPVTCSCWPGPAAWARRAWCGRSKTSGTWPAT